MGPAPPPPCHRCGDRAARTSRNASHPLCYGCFGNALKVSVLQSLQGGELLKAGNGALLVALSGGCTSLALLDLLLDVSLVGDAAAPTSPEQLRSLKGKEKLLANRANRRLSRVVAAHVADGGGDGDGDPNWNTNALRDACRVRNVELHVLSLADATPHLPALLAAARDATARRDVRTLARTRLLARTARELGCATLLSGESLDGAAVRVLTDITEGSHGVNADLGVADLRGLLLDGGPVVLHAMRGITRREAALWCFHRGMALATTPPPPPDRRTTLRACAEALVNSLAAERRDAALQIVRAAEKVEAFPAIAFPRGGTARVVAGAWRAEGALAKSGVHGVALCPLCRAPLLPRADSGGPCPPCRTNLPHLSSAPLPPLAQVFDA